VPQPARTAAPAVRQVVDVIGAGDAFVAGYLSARVDEAPVSERLRAGSAHSRILRDHAGRLGGPAQPRRAGLDELSRRHHSALADDLSEQWRAQPQSTDEIPEFVGL
jgi:hypothetical protein